MSSSDNFDINKYIDGVNPFDSHFGRTVGVLNLFNEKYFAKLRGEIPPPGQIKRGEKYDKISGNDLWVIYAAISTDHRCQSQSTPYQRKVCEYFEKVIHPITTHLGLEIPSQNTTEKFIGYRSDDPNFLIKLILADSDDHISQLADTISYVDGN